MPRWVLISAEKGKQKFDVLRELLERLAKRGTRVGGFQQIGKRTGDSKCYHLARVGGSERISLAVDGVGPRGPNEEQFCSMAFDNDAFGRARVWLEEDAGRCEVLVLSEISKLETSGKGHAATLAWACGLPGSAGGPSASAAEPLLILCVRSSQLFYVMENFGLPEPLAALELPAEEADKVAFFEAVEKLCPPASRAAA